MAAGKKVIFGSPLQSKYPPMILYNVTIKIDKTVEKEWLEWMKTRHIPDVMATGEFSDYRISRLLEPVEAEEEPVYVIQYMCSNLHKYNHYILHHAQRLREEHALLFRDYFVAFRTVMETV